MFAMSQVQPGDRFEDRDSRNEGRVVQVTEKRRGWPGAGGRRGAPEEPGGRGSAHLRVAGDAPHAVPEGLPLMSAPSVLAAPEVVAGRFVEHMSEDEYHAHPALSSTGMKNLLRSAKYFRMQRSMNKSKPEFDEGHAIHALILGVGAPIVEIPDRLLSGEYRSISSKDAKEWKAKAESEGNTVLKPAQYARVTRAAESVLANPKARRLLERPGFSEASLFATDPVTGVDVRCRFDRLSIEESSPVGLDPLDVKSTPDVSLRKVERAIVDLGYDVQAFAYRYVLSLLLGVDVTDIPPMTFIFTEKEPPFDVRVVRLADPVWAVGGEAKMRAAIDLFAWCSEQGRWPGDDDDDGPVLELSAPAWYRAQYTEEETW